MSRDESSVALRDLIRGTCTAPGSGDDIANIVASELPDGAACFVLENRVLYRYRKYSVLAVSGTTVIAPNAGGGRWVQEGVPAGSLALFVAATSTNTIDSSASDGWLPAITSDFALQAGAGAWTFNPDSCIATYRGPPGRYLCRLQASITVDEDQSCNVVIALNDDITGSEAAFAEGEQFAEIVPTGEKTLIFSAERLVTLVSQDNIRPKFRIGPTAGDTDIQRLTLSVVPVP